MLHVVCDYNQPEGRKSLCWVYVGQVPMDRFHRCLDQTTLSVCSHSPNKIQHILTDIFGNKIEKRGENLKIMSMGSRLIFGKISLLFDANSRCGQERHVRLTSLRYLPYRYIRYKFHRMVENHYIDARKKSELFAFTYGIKLKYASIKY